MDRGAVIAREGACVEATRRQRGGDLRQRDRAQARECTVVPTARVPSSRNVFPLPLAPRWLKVCTRCGRRGAAFGHLRARDP